MKKLLSRLMNGLLCGVCLFFFIGVFFSLIGEPPIEVSKRDLWVNRLDLLALYLPAALTSLAQLKFRKYVPLLKENSFAKSVLAWIIVFFFTMWTTSAVDKLYSSDYHERYAIYQQQQELIEEKETQEKQEEELQEQLTKEQEKLEQQEQLDKENAEVEKQENQQSLVKEESKKENEEQVIQEEDHSKYFEFRYVVEPIKGEGKNKDKRLVKYYTKNISNQIISAKEYVTFFDQTGKHIVGSQLGYIEELNPGYEAWSSIYVDDDFSSLKYEVEYSDVTFKKALQDNLQVDVETTQKVQEEFRLNFEEATWYKTIKSLEVYTDGSCKLIADTDNNGMASAVYFCCSQYGLKTVVVYNSAGTLVSSYSGK